MREGASDLDSGLIAFCVGFSNSIPSRAGSKCPQQLVTKLTANRFVALNMVGCHVIILQWKEQFCGQYVDKITFGILLNLLCTEELP